MQTDPFFANTWRFAGMAGHVISMSNETAYTDDSPSDYYFPTGVEQWEPDALVFLGESIGEALEHHHTIPSESLIPKIYKVADSASYIKPYSQRDHSWNDAEY